MASIAAGQWLAGVDRIRSRDVVNKNLRSDHKRLVFKQFLKLVHENYSKERQVMYLTTVSKDLKDYAKMDPMPKIN